jgi:hypothetical protein
LTYCVKNTKKRIVKPIVAIRKSVVARSRLLINHWIFEIIGFTAKAKTRPNINGSTIPYKW